MTTIRQGFLILSTAGLLPALPAAADSPAWPAAQAAIPAASEPEAPTTSWEPLRFALAAEIQTAWMLQDDARRLWGKRNVGGAGLSLSYDAVEVSDRMTLGLDLSWLATVVSTTMAWTAAGLDLPQKSSTQVFSLGLSLRYQVFRWLSPYARVAGGTGWAALTVGSPGFDLRDRAFLYQGSAGAGLLFRSSGVRLIRSPRWPPVAFVGRVEGGYTMGNATNFSLTLHTDGSIKDPIPVAPVSVGEVARRFPYLRVSVGVGF
jgi:hypothetical protein